MAVRRVPSFSARPGFPAGLRVLLLDFSTPNRQQAGAQLKQCAYEVTCCSSITEALSAISNAKSAAAPFDVLLGEASALTGKSPECDRLREQLKELPTIVMSESPKPEEVMRSIKLGVAEVLERPLCPLKLKNIWQHAVRRMLRAPNSPPSRRNSSQLDRAGSRRVSNELCSSQNGSTTATQSHLLSPAVGSPDPTSASSGMANMQDALLKSELYTVQQPSDAAPVAAAAASDPTPADTGSPTASRRGSKEEGDESRRGSKRKSKEIARGSAAPPQLQQEGARRGSSGTPAPAEQQHVQSARDGNSTSSSQNGACLPMELPAVAAPLPLGCLDAANAVPGACFPPFTPATACSSLPWPTPPLPAGCLPPGMSWGVPLNPMAVAPGITPPIFPTSVPPPMMLPPPQAWPAFPQSPLAGMPLGAGIPLGAGMPMNMPGAGMFSPLMPGLGMPQGNPFMPHMLPGQLPPLPMSMLMGACGPDFNLGTGGMCGMPDNLESFGQMGLQAQHQGNMASPCSPCPTDPSLTNLSDKSAQDVLTLGFEDITFMGLAQDLPAPKMPRCESNALLPSLEDLIKDQGADTDMELELEALSLACLGHAATARFKRNDSLDDLISQSVVAF